MKKNIMPRRILSCDFIKFSEELIIPTQKIITGMLKIITIRLPIAKFLLFNKFIEPEIEQIQVIINEPIIKLKNTNSKLFISICNNRRAIGRMMKNGIWRIIQKINILIKEIISYERPLKWNNIILLSLKSSWKNLLIDRVFVSNIKVQIIPIPILVNNSSSEPIEKTKIIIPNKKNIKILIILEKFLYEIFNSLFNKAKIELIFFIVI